MIQIITKDNSNCVFMTDLHVIKPESEIIIIFVKERINNRKFIRRYSYNFKEIERLLINGKDINLYDRNV